MPWICTDCGAEYDSNDSPCRECSGERFAELPEGRTEIGPMADAGWTVIEERKLRASGNSTVLSMPPNVLQELRLEVGDDVELVADRDEGTITIRPVED